MAKRILGVFMFLLPLFVGDNLIAEDELSVSSRPVFSIPAWGEQNDSRNGNFTLKSSKLSSTELIAQSHRQYDEGDVRGAAKKVSTFWRDSSDFEKQGLSPEEYRFFSEVLRVSKEKKDASSLAQYWWAIFQTNKDFQSRMELKHVLELGELSIFTSRPEDVEKVVVILEESVPEDKGGLSGFSVKSLSSLNNIAQQTQRDNFKKIVRSYLIESLEQQDSFKTLSVKETLMLAELYREATDQEYFVSFLKSTAERKKGAITLTEWLELGDYLNRYCEDKEVRRMFLSSLDLKNDSHYGTISLRDLSFSQMRSLCHLLNDFSESSPDLGFVGGKWLTDEKTWAAVSPEVKECIYQALLGDREELDLFKNTISDKFAKDSLNPEEHAILLSFLVCSHDKALRENWSKAAVDRYLSLDQPSVEELERVVQYLPWGRESVSPEAIQAIAKGLVRWNDTIEAPEEKSIQQFARMLERCPVWKERFESELFSKEEGINVPVAEVLLHLYERNGRLRQFFLNLKQEMVKSDSDNSDLQARFFRVLGYAMKLGYPKKPYVSIGYYEQAFSVAEANTQKLACLCDLITAYIDSGQDTKALQLMQSIENQWREKDQESITEIRKTILVKNDSL